MVSPGFFDVFRIPTVRGRRFADADNRFAPPVVLINQAMAQQFWPAGNPLHEYLVIGKGLGPEFEEAPREIVGVVGDVRDVRLNQTPIPTGVRSIGAADGPIDCTAFPHVADRVGDSHGDHAGADGVSY